MATAAASHTAVACYGGHEAAPQMPFQSETLLRLVQQRVHTSRTSAEPQRLLTDRFPCFATFAPAAAAITHAPVEMFTEPMPSPPVPTMSTTAWGVSTGNALARIAAARPASSAAVSPSATMAV